MQERWQWLKIIAGVLFLGAAALLYFTLPKTPRTLVFTFLFLFLGLYYPLSALYFRWLLKKFGFTEGENGVTARKKKPGR